MNILSRFMTAATFVVGISANASAQDSKLRTTISSDEILMSDQTRELFKPEFWRFVFKLEVPPTLIFSRADFEHSNPAERQAERETNFRKLRNLGINIPKLSRHFYEIFENHSIDRHNAGAVGHDLIIPILHQQGHKIGLDISKLSENARIDIVSVMSDNNARGFFAAMSGIPEDSIILENIPVEDLRAFIMFHEIDHLVHADPNMSRLESEWAAEVYAHKTYKDANEKGIVSTPNLPILFSWARSMNAFSKGQLNTLLEIGDTLLNFAPNYEMTAIAASYKPEEKPDFESLDADFNKAYKDIITEVGRGFATTSEFKYKTHLASAGRIYLTMVKDKELSLKKADSIIKFFEDINARGFEVLDQEIAYHKGERTDLPEKIDYKQALEDFKKLFVIPPKYLDIYNAERERYIKEEAPRIFLKKGLELARQQPSLAYSAARRLLEIGFFDKNPAGAALAENFVRGAETLAPAYFAVDAVAGPTYSALNPLPINNNSPETLPSGNKLQFAPQ